MIIETDKSPLRSFLVEFNTNVARKYALSTSESRLSDEDIEKHSLFRNYNTMNENIYLLKASYYNQQTISIDLASRVSEAYANVQIKAGNKIDISDCLPKQKLSAENIENLKKQNPKLYSLCMK